VRHVNIHITMMNTRASLWYRTQLSLSLSLSPSLYLKSHDVMIIDAKKMFRPRIYAPLKTLILSCSIVTISQNARVFVWGKNSYNNFFLNPHKQLS
jgi:hypothetical protein